LMQWQAIKSWTLLNPKPDIFLLGNAPGVAAIANELGLYHLPNVDQNASISEIAKWLDRLINNTILVYINPSVILTESFTQTIQEVYKNQEHFLLTGQSRTIQTEGVIDFNDNQWQHQLRVMADKQGMPQGQLQNIYLVFTKQLLKQLWVLDPNVESTWEQQLFYAALQKYYPIIDGSPIITAFLQTPKHSKWKVVDGLVIEGVPPDFELPPIVGENNDYTFIEEKRQAFIASAQPYKLGVSIIIPVYNRKTMLAKTLAAITHQTYPANLIEVIVADDGSHDGVEKVIQKYKKHLTLKYVRQDDQGYRLSAVRNLGSREAKYDYIAILDCDVLPTPKYIELLMQYFHVTDKAALMGHRRFVCTDNITDDQILENITVALALPDVMPSDECDRPEKEGEPIVDHRLKGYKKDNDLKGSLFSFHAFYGCSMAYPKKVIAEVGPFDEDFQAWGCEDIEMGYRIYNAGYYFIPVLEAIGLHQEPPDSENETDRSEGRQVTRDLLIQKCPAPVFRQYQPDVIYDVPKVSIYMAAYNAEKYIKRAVDSALAQTYTDLEVCIVNDGSTDNTLKVLEQNYQNNPRVRWISQENRGVANTFNTAVGLCRGMYLGHLDADDILLRLDAVEIMVKYLDTYNVGCVYSYCRKIDENNITIGEVGCFPVFCREKFMNSMMVVHFRLFRKCDWARLDGEFDETLENAEDYDLFLRLSEICSFHHLQAAFYGYRWHGENVSLIHQERQIKHHGLVIQRALKRNGMDKEWEAYVPDPKKPRTTLFRKKVLDAQTESSVVDKLYEYALAYPNSRHNIQEIHDAFSLVEGVKPRGDYLYAERQELIPLFKAKILYTFIPKIACTSIKHLIFECERGTPYVEKKKLVSGIHGFYQTWREITTNYVYSDNWLKVLIVREPLQRLVSCYKNRVLFHKDLLKSADRLSKVGLPVNPSWEVFIDNFERYRSLSQSINHHSAPIVDFAGYNPDFYDLILNISELDKLLSVVSDRMGKNVNKIPHEQTGGSKIDIGEISEKAKEKIQKFYAQDYDIYGKYFGGVRQNMDHKCVAFQRNEEEPKHRVKTIYIHIGIHKTGTTSLQALFAKNKLLLERKDIYYPTEGLYSVNNRRHLLAHAVCDKPIPEKFRRIIELENIEFTKEKCIADIRRDVDSTDCNHILITSENFWGSDLKALNKLKSVFDKLSFEPRFIIIAYVRRQDKYIISEYNQEVKDKRVQKHDFEQFAAGRIKNISHSL
ncbi:MAG: glycosyltransferase, partial [Candidatus Parabeggiatoa sp.]|nr:glycosyltransferase [Candidatus Parabeggiatoa sp.]